MPDFTWIDGKTNFFPSSSYNIRELTFRKSSDPYDQWGPELNDDQQAQVEAGFDLLTSLWSNQLLSDLTAQLAATNATSPTPAGTDLLRVVWRVYNRLLEPTITAPAGVDEFLTPPAGPHVALRRSNHPWLRLLYSEQSAFTINSDLLGANLEAPKNFVFPLAWDLATADLTLPKKTRDKLREAAAWFAEPTVQIPSVVALLVARGPVSPLLFLAMRSLRDAVPDTIIALRERIEAAAESGVQLNDVLALLIYAVEGLLDPVLDGLAAFADIVGSAARLTGWVYGALKVLLTVGFADFENWLLALADALKSFVDDQEDFESRFVFGMSSLQARELALRLLTKPEEQYEHLGGASVPGLDDAFEAAIPPTLFLDPDLLSAFPARHFQAVVGLYDYPGSTFWVEAASPTLQYAYAAEVGGIIFELLFHQESATLAMAGLANAEGRIGELARVVLADQGQSCLVDALGGVSLARVFRFVWRQVMVDLYLYQAEFSGYDLTCLHEIFCWMKSAETRRLLDEVLGVVTSNAYARDLRTGLILKLFSATDFCVAWDAMAPEDQAKVRTLFTRLDRSCLGSWPDTYDGSNQGKLDLEDWLNDGLPDWVTDHDLLDHWWLDPDDWVVSPIPDWATAPDVGTNWFMPIDRWANGEWRNLPDPVSSRPTWSLMPIPTTTITQNHTTWWLRRTA